MGTLFVIKRVGTVIILYCPNRAVSYAMTAIKNINHRKADASFN